MERAQPSQAKTAVSRGVGALLAVAMLAGGYLLGARSVPPAPPAPATLPSLAPIVEQVRRGVVGVTSVAPGRSLPEHGGTPEFDVVHGSGFVLHREGLVVTSRHLLQDPMMVFVDVPEQGRIRAEIVGEDPTTDIALLRLSEPLVNPVGLTLGEPRPLRQGDWVIAVGDPFEFSQSVSVGVVSYVGRHLPGEGLMVTNDFLQISAPINPGNSGGPVFDLEGRVIGVVTRTHESGEGIAFAVPVRVLRWVLDSMQRNAGRVPRGYLGIRFQPLVPRDREQYAVAEGGALVVEVHPGQPADRAGIRPRDVILAFDGQPVRTAYDLHDWITQGPPGRQVQLDLSRGGSAIEPVTVTLAEPATHAADGEQPRPGKH